MTDSTWGVRLSLYELEIAEIVHSPEEVLRALTTLVREGIITLKFAQKVDSKLEC